MNYALNVCAPHAPICIPIMNANDQNCQLTYRIQYMHIYIYNESEPSWRYTYRRLSFPTVGHMISMSALVRGRSWQLGTTTFVKMLLVSLLLPSLNEAAISRIWPQNAIQLSTISVHLAVGCYWSVAGYSVPRNVIIRQGFSQHQLALGQPAVRHIFLADDMNRNERASWRSA